MDFRIVVRDKSCHKGSIVAAVAADATEGYSHNMCTGHVQEREKERLADTTYLYCASVCVIILEEEEREKERGRGRVRVAAMLFRTISFIHVQKILQRKWSLK